MLCLHARMHACRHSVLIERLRTENYGGSGRGEEVLHRRKTHSTTAIRGRLSHSKAALLRGVTPVKPDLASFTQVALQFTFGWIKPPSPRPSASSKARSICQRRQKRERGS
jgi:hypothetical protein